MFILATTHQKGYRFQPISSGLTNNHGDCNKFLHEIRRAFLDDNVDDYHGRKQLEYFECMTRNQNKIKKKLIDKQKQLNRLIQMIKPRYT